jgi:ribose 5-phosphate isomerase B
MRVHIGSDHAGFELKAHLVEQLGERGYDVVDHGPLELDPVDDYPPYVLRAAVAVVNDAGSLGVVIGGSGNGEAIAANKVPGVRAALCGDAQTASGARKWNDANALALSLRTTSEPLLHEILDAWLAGQPSPDSDDRANVEHVDEIG